MSNVTHDPSPAEPTTPAEPSAPEDSSWMPSREEWEQTQHAVRYLADAVQAEQSAIEEAEQAAQAAQLEELALEDPATYARLVAEQAIAQHVAPLAEFVARQEAAEIEAEGEGLAFGMLGEIGFEGEEAEQVYRDADADFRAALEQFGGDEALARHVEQTVGLPPGQGLRYAAALALSNRAEYTARTARPARSVEEVFERHYGSTPFAQVEQRPAESIAAVLERHFGHGRR